MRKLALLSLLVVIVFSLVACSANVHKIGNGPQTNNVQTARQWYALFGLIPINTVDTNQMAQGAKDYEITTAITPTDFFINIFTQYVTINSRTVTVKR
jgi:hypothetical protein